MIVDTVSSRFYACSNYLGGATEVVTVCELSDSIISENDIKKWVLRNEILCLKPEITPDGYLALVKNYEFDPAEIIRYRYIENCNLDNVMLIELDEPLKGSTWRITFYIYQHIYFIAWRRNHLISDAFTTDKLLGDLMSNISKSNESYKNINNFTNYTTFQHTNFQKIILSQKDQAKISKKIKEINISFSSYVLATLTDILSEDFRKGKAGWLAYSRRKTLEDQSFGCKIGVAFLPHDQAPTCFLALAQKYDQIAKEESKNPSLDFEKMNISIEKVKETQNACLGPCVTNSGAYKSISEYNFIHNIATCVDRRNANYSIVAHLDRFRGRLSVNLSCSVKIFNRKDILILSKLISTKLTDNLLIL